MNERSDMWTCTLMLSLSFFLMTTYFVPDVAADVFVRDTTIDLGEEQISLSSDGRGHFGEGWRMSYRFAPIQVRAGDTISGTISFAGNEQLKFRDNGGGYQQVGYTTGRENLYVLVHSPSETGVLARSFATYQFSVVEGSPLVNPISGSHLFLYDGIGTQKNLNLINTGDSFQFDSFTFEIAVSELSVDPLTVDEVTVRLYAEDISIVPEPSTLVMFASGAILIIFAWYRKRRKYGALAH